MKYYQINQYNQKNINFLKYDIFIYAVIDIEIVRKGFNWCLNTLHNGRWFYLVP